MLVVWRTNWRWGLAFASLCALTSWVARTEGNPYHTGWAFALAVFGWWFYFSILVVAVAATKSHQDLARGLFAVPMDGPGLSIALDELARSSTRLNGMSVAFLEPVDILVAEPEHGMHLYRIAREAVSNAARHSGAERS